MGSVSDDRTDQMEVDARCSLFVGSNHEQRATNNEQRATSNEQRATNNENRYSHRNTFADTTMHATNMSVNAATSPECLNQPSPCQMPRKSETAYVNGSTRATACSAGGNASTGTNSPESPSIG